MQTVESPWLTSEEAAAYLKVSKGTFKRYVRDKIVTGHKIANLQSVRYKTDELDAIFVPTTATEAEVTAP